MSMATYSPASEETRSSSSLQWQQQCRHFTVSEIQLATNNFSESLVIGRGGFGKVYKATIINGSSPVIAAIKRLDSTSNQGATEFRAEIEMLSKLRHCHLVSLIGYCNEEMILVYEYIQRGTLEDHLHKLHTPLSWERRLKICIGAARGLDYLHTGTGIKHGVIHRDVKTSNILLDESWAARISDFGLSKIGPTNQPSTYVNTAVRGTFGYLDPDYSSTGRLTRKADVYAFGVILMEVLCGKRAVDSSLDDEQWNLAIWAQDSIKGGRLKQIVDLDLRVEILPKCLKEYARLAERCLDIRPAQRPTMAEVVVSLQLVLNLQVKANKSMHPAGVTIFGRKVPMFLLPSNGENSGKVTSASLPPSPRSPWSEAEILQSADLKCFSFNVLKTATRNFRLDPMVGEGFLSIYKGWIDEQSLAAATPGTGTAITVKALNEEDVQGLQEWLAEINCLGTLNHPNLVKLIGYCLEDDHRCLVYEFIPRGSLEYYLLRRGCELSWNLRIKVALGTAKGLAYLHSPEGKMIYRDFKSSNILIDSNYNAKLSDFWLAKGWPTYGCYAATDHMATGRLTARSDIYSFGVVLLQILTGRRCIDMNCPCREQRLVEFAKPYLTSKRKILKIMDPRIKGQYASTEAMRAGILAMKCLTEEPKHRPTAEEVVKELEQLEELQKASEVSREEPIW